MAHAVASSLWQLDVREEDLRDGQQRAASLPGQPVCVLPDGGARLLRHGVRSGRRPDDAHPRRRLLRAQGRVSARRFAVSKSFSPRLIIKGRCSCFKVEL